ncbi:class I mannose-6-phosphate isomerase [Croceicoccus sp. F390]|uniref:Class I mannose-6-phosphate isomerase n=1 Tax=Croceicoccus esteveae TaxID=3075597 RepID=A0ABU2ZKB1_9SPHN|nr:class I mannose-6-phosphate isomerase [Croceicoccus sp. F390]MDT0576810.1 class I mannose-6-phosphate isomerase [Croceicoccus sp. F390]
MGITPSLLKTSRVKKPWGRFDLPTPFSNSGDERIGEIWFEPDPLFDALLVKYLFTDEKLSIQVHPNGSQARASGAGSRGKDECWYVIDAQPGATLGVGFAERIEADAMRRAALDGSIEELLVWHPVARGDFFYIPANTVHSIGAGVSLIEVQQNSDITYRLFDYGRPRELHLDRGIDVARGEPHDSTLRRHLPERGAQRLVSGPYFLLDRLDGSPDDAVRQDYKRPLLVIPLDRSVIVGETEVEPGACGMAPTIEAVQFAQDGLCLIARPCS